MEPRGIFHQPPPEWSATRLRVKAENGWTVFYEKRSKPLNQPRSRAPDCHRLYRHKSQPSPSPHGPGTVVGEPIGDNYTAFKVRTQLTPRERDYDPRRLQCPSDIDTPEPKWRRGLRGDDPERNPFRASQQLANERRLEEIREMTVAEPSPKNHLKLSLKRGKKRAKPGNHDAIVPSLYARSLKPNREDYEWPRDFFDFPRGSD
jgi:hypothetical protein